MRKSSGSTMKIGISFGVLIAFILAFAPVMDPYVLINIADSQIMVIDVLVILCAVFAIAHKGIKVCGISKHLFVLMCVLIFLTLIAFSTPNQNRSIILAFKNLVIWIVYITLVAFMWNDLNSDKFIKYATTISMIATALIIIQFIAGHVGIAVWNGRIPGLEIGKYDGWAGYIDKNTGDIRPNGIFQEPSYYSIYTLPIIMNHVEKKNYRFAVAITVALVITTSMVGVVGAVLVWGISFAKRATDKGQFLKSIGTLVLLVTVSTILLIVLYNRIPFVQSSFDYVLNRITNFSSDLNGTRMSSTKYRILGYVSYFNNYSTFQRIFGVGAAQFSAFNNIHNGYSNTWVTTLLDYGYLGVVTLGTVLISIAIKDKNRTVWPYMAIIAIVFACDRLWFNWYFFYLFTWAYIYYNKQRRSK